MCSAGLVTRFLSVTFFLVGNRHLCIACILRTRVFESEVSTYGCFFVPDCSPGLVLSVPAEAATTSVDASAKDFMLFLWLMLVSLDIFNSASVEGGGAGESLPGNVL